MTLDDSILRTRLRVMRRAQELGSVIAACREAGISRTVFYRWRQRLERYGFEGLHPRRRQARAGRPAQVPCSIGHGPPGPWSSRAMRLTREG